MPSGQFGSAMPHVIRGGQLRKQEDKGHELSRSAGRCDNESTVRNGDQHGGLANSEHSGRDLFEPHLGLAQGMGASGRAQSETRVDGPQSAAKSWVCKGYVLSREVYTRNS